MDLKKIKQLLKLMDDNELGEVTIKHGEDMISLKKKDHGLAAAPAFAAPAAPQAAPAAPAAAPSEPAAAPASSDGPPAGVVEVKSPMVATFYQAASPDVPAFVQEGDTVKSGATLCILEAMKLMNELKSEVSGKVVKILAEDGQAVEFGQVLFWVEK